MRSKSLKNRGENKMVGMNGKVVSEGLRVFGEGSEEKIENHSIFEIQNSDSSSHNLPPCLRKIIQIKCSEGHTFYLYIGCYKEWCRHCGGENGPLHKRRMARLRHKIMQMEGPLGYLVITFPSMVIKKLKNKENLNKVRRYLVRKFKREGFQRGVVTFHLGNKEGKFQPHLNLILEKAKYLDKRTFLKRWKNDIAYWILRNFGIKIKQVVIYYSYFSGTKEERYSLLWYITRPTLTHPTPKIAKLLEKYRTISHWGIFKAQQRNKKCPTCRGDLHAETIL